MTGPVPALGKHRVVEQLEPHHVGDHGARIVTGLLLLLSDLVGIGSGRHRLS